jgi:hypothetical protein
MGGNTVQGNVKTDSAENTLYLVPVTSEMQMHPTRNLVTDLAALHYCFY